MKKFQRFLAAGLAVLLSVGVTACGSNDGKDEKEEVNIGYFNNVTHAQALLIKSEGSMEDVLGDTATVKWTAFNAGPAEVEALFSGDIDIGYIGPVPAVSANVKSKGDVGILAGATKGGSVLVKKKDSDISSIEDLKGKVVAIPQIGNTQHLILLQLLSEKGLKPVTDGGDVTVSAVANADVANTMERGDIDAALVPEPWGATLLDGGAELVYDYDKLYLNGDYDVAVVVVRKEFQEEHPEIVEKFLEVHNAATVTINEDTENSLAKINKELDNATGKSLSDEIIKEAFERIVVTADYSEESVREFANISKEQKFIEELPGDDLFSRKDK